MFEENMNLDEEMITDIEELESIDSPANEEEQEEINSVEESSIESDSLEENATLEAEENKDTEEENNEEETTARFAMPETKTEEELVKEEVKKEPQIELLPNEIGRVVDLKIDSVIIKVTSKEALEQNLADRHVVLAMQNGQKIVGTITAINSEAGAIKLIG